MNGTAFKYWQWVAVLEGFGRKHSRIYAVGHRLDVEVRQENSATYFPGDSSSGAREQFLAIRWAELRYLGAADHRFTELRLDPAVADLETPYLSSLSDDWGVGITLEWITSNFDIASVGHGRFWCDYLVEKEKTATYRRPPGNADLPSALTSSPMTLQASCTLSNVKGPQPARITRPISSRSRHSKPYFWLFRRWYPTGLDADRANRDRRLSKSYRQKAKGSRVGILGGTALLLTPGQHCEHIQEEYGQDSTNDTNSGFCIHLLSPPYLLKMHARGPSLALIFKRLTCFSYYSRGLEYSRPQTDRARHRELESRRECNNRNRLIFNSG